MCWACYANNLKSYVAEKDINVYKIVKKANKKLCVSEFQKFTYYKNIEPPELNLMLFSNIRSGFLKITEGYYSYKSVSIEFGSLGRAFGSLTKIMYLGTHKSLVLIDNDFYLATFVIPKGSIYFVNPLDVIVSSRIKYTGKFIKM